MHVAANAVESFIFFSNQATDAVCLNTAGSVARGSDAMVQSTRAHGWIGQLELARNHPLKAAAAFEQALPKSFATLDHWHEPDLAWYNEHLVHDAVPSVRNRHCAMMGLVETSLLAGKFQRALCFLNITDQTSSDIDTEQRARIYHLRARAYAGLGHSAAALKSFSNAITAYTAILQSQCLPTDARIVAYDLADRHRRPQRSKRIIKSNSPAACMSLSTAQLGRALVYYHLSIFRVAMRLKLEKKTANGTPQIREPLPLETRVTNAQSHPENNLMQVGIPNANHNALCSTVAFLLHDEQDSPAIESTETTSLQLTSEEPALVNLSREGARHSEALGLLNIEEISEAIKQNPTLISARLTRAALHIAGGNFALAFADFDAVLHIEPLCTRAYVNRAVLFFQLGKNTVEALTNLNEAIAMNEVPRFSLNSSLVGRAEVTMLALALCV